MKNPDEAIEQVMRGIRDAQTPEGMEQRILRAMQKRAAEPQVRTSRPWIWSLGVASVAAAAPIAVWMHRAPLHPVNQIAVQQVAVTPAVTHEVTVETSSSVRSVPLPKAKLTKRLASVPVSTEDELAMSEMLAPSQPAPAEPLTEQERLLLRAVHKGDPEELASLGPVKRAAWAAREKAEYENFFREPPIVPAEGGNE